MKTNLVLIGLLSLVGFLTCTPNAEKMNRAALVALMEPYLAALGKNDPAGVPLAAEVKLVENIAPHGITNGWE